MTEQLFTVTGSSATPAVPVTLAEAGLRERSDLQEWVLAHPEILGPDVLVVTFEFDRWSAAGGDRERDRLDVLGIGTDVWVPETQLTPADLLLQRQRQSGTIRPWRCG